MREELPMTFAELLRTKRLEAGCTQEKLARRCGVSPAAIQVWERGGVAPGIGCLKLISTALNLPLTQLLDCEFPVDHRLKVTVAK